MKIAEQSRRRDSNSDLDLQTIRRRVAKIKNSWTPEVAHARAAEGKRRRRELDSLVETLLQEMRDDFLADCGNIADEENQLTLIG